MHRTGKKCLTLTHGDLLGQGVRKMQEKFYCEFGIPGLIRGIHIFGNFPPAHSSPSKPLSKMFIWIMSNRGTDSGNFPYKKIKFSVVGHGLKRHRLVYTRYFLNKCNRKRLKIGERHLL